MPPSPLGGEGFTGGGRPPPMGVIGGEAPGTPFEAQPLAALPLYYGCGVLLAGKWVQMGEDEQRSE